MSITHASKPVVDSSVISVVKDILGIVKVFTIVAVPTMFLSLQWVS